MTGWMIPMGWIERVPTWTTMPVLGQVLWKWLALLLLIVIAFAVLIAVFHLVGRKPWDGSVGSYLRYLLRPLALLLVTLLVGHLATQQINVTGAATRAPDYMLELAKGFAGVWGIWLTARWIAGALVATPREVSLMRLVVQAIGIFAAIALAFRIAHNLGIPVYGLVAGAGVGGLGIALAARSTLENFLGTLNLYADRPVRVGDFCRYGKEAALGTIEEIGLRSTRIRGIDRTITTIPNAEFSNMHIINLTQRDRMLFRTTLNLRYETTRDQLRLVIVRVREMLVAHPRVTMAPSRVRAVGFGEYSLDLEIFAYVNTADWDDFLAVQEDLVLRLLDIVDDAGAAFAFPSRTLYHGRDRGTDDERREAAEHQVRRWVAAHELPFPDLSAEHRKRLRDTLDYPPTGSVADARR
jgi:MscS family membrane protein